MHNKLQSLLSLHAAPTSNQPVKPADYFSALPRVETDRLLLRPLSMRDAADMFDYSRDPEVARHVLWDAHRSMNDTKGYLRYIIGQYHSASPSSWGIVWKENNRLIGTIGFMSYSEPDNEVELGYSLARAYWNRGIMTEALRAVLRECFVVLRIHRVEAMHESINPSSGRVMEKCGMRHEGCLRGKVFNKGRFRDVELWAILREDYLGKREERTSPER